jgi:hypothetical protein
MYWRTNITLFSWNYNRPNIVNPRRIDEYFKDLEREQHLALLVDEFSLLSFDIVKTMNNALIHTTLKNHPMGGVLTIFFGDFAQLTPVPPSS